MSLFLNKQYRSRSGRPKNVILSPDKAGMRNLHWCLIHKIRFFATISMTDREGFTLLEILIAVTLLSVVLAAIYSTFMLSHRATEGMDESLLKTQEARKALDILKRELDATVYRSKDSLTLLKIQDRDIFGKQAAQLTFTTFSPLRPGLSRISYYVEEKDKKLYLFKKIASLSDTEETEGIDIIDDLGSFTVEARYNDTWVRTWDTDINKGVPDEIRISLSFLVKGREVTFFDISLPKVDKPIS
jgi:general secretion pathway protein J